MNRDAMRAIIARDLRVVGQNRGVMLPLVIVPVLLLIVLPAFAAWAPTAAVPGSPLAPVTALRAQMPEGLKAQLSRWDETQQAVILLTEYVMAPLYLMIPLMVASVIAADSFAGEKERKTLEMLLYTPTSDRELFLAKVLSAWIPACLVAWGGLAVYGLVANLVAWPTMQAALFPNRLWTLLAFWVAPAVAGMGLGAMVLVSARAEGFQDAYQMGGVVVIPLVILIVAQVSGVIYLRELLVFALGALLWLVDALILGIGARRFHRDALAQRL
ncbi:MAG: hypothetical protein Kow0047_16510 [Anaerolineae bacterium]